MSECRWQRGDNFTGTQLDEAFVILCMDNDSYYAFNRSATDIWDLLAEPRTQADLTATLREMYDVDERVCAQAVARTVAEFMECGLVHAVA